MKIQKELLFIVSLLLVMVAAQERPRTRLEIMIDDLVKNVGNMASRINYVMFSENPPRRRPRPPFTPQAIEGGIDSFPEVIEIENGIDYDNQRQADDSLHAPNSPHHQHHAPNSPHFNHLDSNAQGTEEFQTNFAPQQESQFPDQFQQHQRYRRPRPPQGSSMPVLLGLRTMVTDAMDRVRDMWTTI